VKESSLTNPCRLARNMNAPTTTLSATTPPPSASTIHSVAAAYAMPARLLAYPCFRPVSPPPAA